MKKMLIIGLAVLAAGGALWYALSDSSADAERRPAKKPVVRRVRRIAEARGNNLKARQEVFQRKQKAEAAKRKRKGTLRPTFDVLSVRTDISEADRKLMKSVQKALDDEDYGALVAMMPKVRTSPNAELRGDFVDALGWFGTEGMLDLLPFLADADESVASSAEGHWEMALNQVDDSKDKCLLVESAMTLNQDREALETMAQELVSCDEVDSLQVLVNLIDGKNPAAAEVAREQYEFITDEKYVDAEKAEAWLAKNYVPEESSEVAPSEAPSEALSEVQPEGLNNGD